MKARFGAWLSVVAILAATSEAWAQGSSMLRMQSRQIERAVSRNLDRVFKPRLVVTKGATGAVTALAMSADEHYLVTGVGNNTVRVWDLWAGREVARLAGHQGRITAIALSEDGAKAVTVSEDKSVKVWNLKVLGQVTDIGQRAAPVSGVALSRSGSRLVTAEADGRLMVWSLPDGKLERELPGHGPGLTHVALVADGSRLVSAGKDGKVVVSDLKGTAAAVAMDAGGPVQALALAGDGALIAAVTGGTRVSMWAPDGTSGPTVTADTGVAGLGFSAKGDTLLVGDHDGGVSVWPVGKGGERKQLGRHEKGVNFVAFNRDGTIALSASDDGTTRLWSVTGGGALLQLISTETGWAVVDSKGRYDGNEEGLEGIDWKAEDVSANVEDFAETHLQPALLPRTVAGGENVPDATSIPEGVRYPATVRFISPNESGKAGQRKVVVEVVADDNGGGVSEIRLYRNGKLVPRDSGNVARQDDDGRTRMVGRFEVDLGPGRNTLSATALNADRLESRPQKVNVDAALENRLEGKLHLLVVGINKYAQKELELGFARPDAESIMGFVKGSGLVTMPVAQIIPIIDGQATRQNILGTMRRLREAAPEDVVMIYMAGHGVTVGDDWFYIPQDIAIPNRLEDLAGIGLSSRELEKEMEALPAERTLMLIDTCQSGTAVSPLNSYRGLKSLRLVARTVGTHILAATDRSQSALELGALGHGVFTYTLLQGLNGKAVTKGGMITATSLIRYVESEVPKLVQSLDEDAQYPTGFSRGIDFAVARKP